MRTFVYILLFALIIILFKAFYWDSRTKEALPETNTSIEATQSESSIVVQPENNISTDSKMPLEHLGDEIADEFKGKL
jgi:biopolymer transport protein ExbD